MAQTLSAEEARAVLQRNVANIVKKAAAGKPLSPREQALIAQFQEEAHGVPPSGGPVEEWVTSYAALGAILGLHRASFPRLRKDHPDCPKPRANGHHSVPAWRAFLELHPEIHCKSESSSSSSSSSPSIPETKSSLELERLRQQCRRLVFSNDVAERKYVLASDAAAWSSEVVGEFVKVLDSIPSTLAPDIVGIPTIAEAELRIRAALEAAKLTLHSAPWAAERVEREERGSVTLSRSDARPARHDPK